MDMFRAEMSKIKVKKGRKKSASQILKDLKEEWSSFSLTDENRVKSIETESLGIIKEEKHGYELKVHRVLTLRRAFVHLMHFVTASEGFTGFPEWSHQLSDTSTAR